MSDQEQVEKASQTTAKMEVEMEARLRAKLRYRLGVESLKEKSIGGLPVDMADVYFICANYIRLVDSFLSAPDEGSSEDLLCLIFEIESHLEDHLPNHHRPLLRGLKRLTKLIEPDERKLEAFIRRSFFEVMKKAKKGSRGESRNQPLDRDEDISTR
ncbi:MAG TPA: hypothetical protein VEZ90_08435 [Blastocatellia bacterium]|nr:hypothetical protein [Blastocatellia bacterium]